MSEAGGTGGEKPSVRFYFDFVSPYSWLALMQAREFAKAHGVKWSLRPVVYGAILDSTGLQGPAEIHSKRRYTIRDTVRCARRQGLKLSGPPAHPFRSLEALRTVCCFESDPMVVDLSIALADAAWGQGLDLTDLSVLRDVVSGLGLPAENLAERIADPAARRRLHALTREALDEGVFGVPTFIHRGEMFWGHDRLPHLADWIEGRYRLDRETADRILERPRGAERRGSRWKEPS